MKPTQTGIAVALALVVIAAFFIFPGLLPFTSSGAVGTETPVTNNNDTNVQTASATASTESAGTPPVTQLTVTDEVVGTGATAVAGDSVTVNYVGALTNGTVFDASANHGTSGFTFTLGAGQVIKGWDEGIVGMKVGGKRKLIIPASLAYGNQAIGNIIPANSTLVFEVELLKVQTQGK
ncbi:FKBP-type peptidyl-prolyl cis-trans isomerase [Patescibacteria group bacterium]|nr:FKBP-type peptidyl-prolyl cis-trans isomerase [Patescibacteria group bacterium]MDE2021371.1 FKBP-type peptidyl-prolyl cis-trans isomerase [Patescibacteria group bacterium]MDE2173341.1 FKBP-type peptidyl-prolyl cis-trans isomerase [Patescibacteria group bacterium]